MAKLSRFKHGTVIGVLTLGIFVPLLDLTIVNLAINTFGSVFSSSITECQWVATVYALAAATVIPLCGWASNRFSGKTMWLTGQVIFLIGSVASASAWSIQSLIAFRALQGLGGGVLMPVMQTVLVRSVGQENAKSAMAKMSIPTVIAPIFGPILGGMILQLAGWRWLFFLNVPACMLAIISAWRYLPQDTQTVDKPLDVRGLLLLSPGLALVVYGITCLGHSVSPYDVGALVTLTAGTGLIGGFLLHAARTNDYPIVDLTLFCNRGFRSSAGLLLFSSVAFFGGLMILPLLLQRLGGFDNVQIGFLLAAQGVGALLSRNYLSSLTAKWGDQKVAYVAVLLAAGSSEVCFRPSNLPTAVLAVALLLRGAGLGLVTIMALSNAYKGLGHEQISHASTLTRIIAQVGASCGTAGLCSALQYSKLASPPIDPSSDAFEWAMLYLLAFTLASFWPISQMDTSSGLDARS